MPAKVGERKKKKRNKKKTGGFFKRGGPNTNDPTPKMASHWLQGETSSVSKNAMVNEKLSYAPAAVAGTTKKQRGFGARIKGMVKGRTKRKGDDDASNSIYSHGGGDYDPHNPPPNRTSHYQARPAHGLDPRLLPQVVEEDDQAMMERLDSSAKRLDYSPERPHEHEMSFAHESFAHDSYVHRQEGEDPTRQAHFEDQQRPQVPAQRRLLFAAAEEEEDGSKGDPISLVLLLVDPETLRFELLQLEFDNPQEILIKDVLQQILTSVTEPAINRLQFHALVDRLGKQHDSKSKLLSACAQRIHNKDLLVGLSKGVTLEHCSRLCRPILGDEKVIGMLEISGYDLTGWAKHKSKESTVEEKTLTTRQSGAQKQIVVAAVAGATLILLVLMSIVMERLFGTSSTTLVNGLLENTTTESLVGRAAGMDDLVVTK